MHETLGKGDTALEGYGAVILLDTFGTDGLGV